LIFIRAGIVYAKNGVTGELEFRDEDAVKVIQATIDALTDGGLILIEKGLYLINKPIVLKSHITLRGEGKRATELRANASIDSVIKWDGVWCYLMYLRVEGANLAAKTVDMSRAVSASALNYIIGCHLKGATGTVLDATNNEDSYVIDTFIDGRDQTETVRSTCGLKATANGGFFVLAGSQISFVASYSIDWKGELLAVVDTYLGKHVYLRHGRYEFHNVWLEGYIEGDATEKPLDIFIYGGRYEHALSTRPNMGGSFHRIQIFGGLFSVPYYTYNFEFVYCDDFRAYARIEQGVNTANILSYEYYRLGAIYAERVWESNLRTSGTATFSGDGATTDFLIGSHGLAESPTDRTRVYAEVTPASADAITGSPCECYASDEDGDGAYESIRVKFASAPPAGTNNVVVRWKAELCG